MSRRLGLGRTLGEAGIHVPQLLMIRYKEREVVFDSLLDIYNNNIF